MLCRRLSDDVLTTDIFAQNSFKINFHVHTKYFSRISANWQRPCRDPLSAKDWPKNGFHPFADCNDQHKVTFRQCNFHATGLANSRGIWFRNILEVSVVMKELCMQVTCVQLQNWNATGLVARGNVSLRYPTLSNFTLRECTETTSTLQQCFIVINYKTRGSANLQSFKIATTHTGPSGRSLCDLLCSVSCDVLRKAVKVSETFLGVHLYFKQVRLSFELNRVWCDGSLAPSEKPGGIPVTHTMSKRSDTHLCVALPWECVFFFAGTTGNQWCLFDDKVLSCGSTWKFQLTPEYFSNNLKMTTADTRADTNR